MDKHIENVSDIEHMYSNDIILVAHDVDCENKWKLSSIFSNAQEIANFNCKVYGCDWKSLKANYNACYVLTRMKLKMYRYPGSSDIVRMNTWPASKVRAVFTRYFSFQQEDGTLIGEAASQWVLMNMTTRSILKPADCNVVTPSTDHIPVPFTIERGDFTFEPDQVTERTPRYSDLDYNGHVNNARYIEWIFDLFQPQWFAENQVTEFDIKYHQEIRYGGKVLLDFKLCPEERKFHVRGRSEEDTVYFEVVGNFETW